MKTNLDSLIAELRALDVCFIEFSQPPHTAKEAFDKIQKKFNDIQYELNKISDNEDREWEKEVLLQDAYIKGLSILKTAFEAHINVLQRGYRS
jgi:hypothetical protein